MGHFFFGFPFPFFFTLFLLYLLSSVSIRVSFLRLLQLQDCYITTLLRTNLPTPLSPCAPLSLTPLSLLS